MSLGEPRDHVIHPRWSPHHQPTATSTLTSSCIVTRQTGPGSTADDGTFTAASPQTLYTGPCRILALTARSQRPIVVGEAQEVRHRYQVSLTWDAPDLRIGDLVNVTESVDPQLPGKRLRVADITFGSEVWQKDLICDELEA